MSNDTEKKMQDERICHDWARTLWIQETPEHMELRGKVDVARRAIDIRDAPTAPEWRVDASVFARDMRGAFDALHAAEEALASLDTKLGEQFDAATVELWKHEASDDPTG